MFDSNSLDESVMGVGTEILVMVKTDKYIVVVLQLLENSCSCYNNDHIIKL